MSLNKFYPEFKKHCLENPDVRYPNPHELPQQELEQFAGKFATELAVIEQAKRDAEQKAEQKALEAKREAERKALEPVKPEPKPDPVREGLLAEKARLAEQQRAIDAKLNPPRVPFPIELLPEGTQLEMAAGTKARDDLAAKHKAEVLEGEHQVKQANAPKKPLRVLD